MAYPKPRNLDPVYFRVERDGKFYDLCFTDLDECEQEQIIYEYDHISNRGWLVKMVKILANRLREIGDELDLEVCDEEP